MSDLAAALAPFDEEALAALTSKGVLRRAGKAQVVADGDGFIVGEHRVTLDAAIIAKRGPAEGARCTCPASGLCAHAVAAILSARGEAVAAGDAWADLAALPLDRLETFAGAQWSPALSVEAGAIVRTGGAVTLRVGLSDKPLGSVTFRPGADVLESALVQPVSANRKRLVTAAALAVRAEQGLARPRAEARAVAILPDGILPDIRTALARAAMHPAEGARDAEDDLRMLALSTRINSAPRLSQTLIRAAAGVRAVRHRGLDGTPGALLSRLAWAYALAQALEARPGDARLTGRLRRDYEAGAPMEVRVLGTEGWSTPEDARGLTTWVYDESIGRLWQVVEARGAGQDPNFQIHSAYDGDWAGGPSRTALAGACARFETPTVIEAENRLNASSRPERVDGPALTEEMLATWPIAFADWNAARRGLDARLPLGLDAGREQAAWIALPHRLGMPRTDPITQDRLWPVADREGRVLELRPRGWTDLAERLVSGRLKVPRAMPLLVASRRDPERGLVTDAVALFLAPPSEPPKGLSRLARWRPSAGEIRPYSLSLDPLPQLERALSLRGPDDLAPPEMPIPPDPVRAIAQRAARLAEEATRPGADLARATRLAAQAEDMGLMALAAALRTLAADPAPDAILRLVYLCDQVGLSGLG